MPPNQTPAHPAKDVAERLPVDNRERKGEKRMRCRWKVATVEIVSIRAGNLGG